MIRYCYAESSVSGIQYVGGLIGYSQGGSAMSCYADSVVSGDESVGGLIGYNNQGWMVMCYAMGPVSGTTDVGGLSGKARTGGDYEDTGNVWDTQTTGCASSAMGTPRTTSEMMTLSTFTDAGWDFADTWMMLREGEDTPRLQWQTIYDGDIAGLYGVNLVDVAYLSLVLAFG